MDEGAEVKGGKKKMKEDEKGRRKGVKGKERSGGMKREEGK